MKSYIIIVLFLITYGLNGQESWVDIINSSSNLDEIKANAALFFEEKGTGKGSGFKQYKRWIHKMQFHVNADNEIRNIGVLQNVAIKSRDRIFESSTRSTNGDWESLGPLTVYGNDAWSAPGVGRVNCMAFHPSNSNVLYAGTAAGGLWKSENNGSNWSPLTDGLPSLGVSEVIVHPSNPNLIYMLTGDGDGADTPSLGVLKSLDGGESWATTSLQTTVDQNKRGYRMVINPDSPDQILVGVASDGIIRTGDGFDTIDTVLTSATIWDIEFAPNNSNIVYAATSNGFYKSQDAGLTWSLAGTGLPSFPGNFPRMAIAISPSVASSVYIVIGGQTVAGSFNGVYKSTNYGSSFTLGNNMPNILDGSTGGSGISSQTGYDLTILVQPDNDAIVYVGAINMWKSTDHGNTWGRETWWTKSFEPTDPYVHADWHNMYYNNNFLYSCNDGGIARSADQGNDWSDIGGTLGIMQFYDIDLIGNNYMGGTQDNGTNGTSINSTSAQNIFGGDGFGCAYHYGNTSIQFISNQNKIARRQYGSNVTIWDDVNQFWFTILKMHLTNPGYLFVSKQNKLYRASQNTAIWDFSWEDLGTASFLPLYNSTGGQEIMGYSQNIDDDHMYLLGTNNIILKTSNLSAGSPNWTQIPDPTSQGAVLSDIVQNEANENQVWMSCSGYIASDKVWRSENGGNTWTNITDNLPNAPVLCIIHDSGITYIGTSVGIYYRKNTMNEWAYFGNGLPNVPVRDLEIHDGYIYAGTYGRGIWKSDLPSNCPSSLVLTNSNDPTINIPGTQIFRATNNILSLRSYSGNPGTNILYQAGSHTDLSLGFEVKAGAFFEAKVGTCED